MYRSGRGIPAEMGYVRTRSEVPTLRQGVYCYSVFVCYKPVLQHLSGRQVASGHSSARPGADGSSRRLLCPYSHEAKSFLSDSTAAVCVNPVAQWRASFALNRRRLAPQVYTSVDQLWPFGSKRTSSPACPGRSARHSAAPSGSTVALQSRVGSTLPSADEKSYAEE